MPLLIFWWLSLTWLFFPHWPNTFEDPKNLLLYTGGGLWGLYTLYRQRDRIPKTGPLFFFLAGYLVIALISTLTPWAVFSEGMISLSRLILWALLAWSFSTLTREQWWKLASVSVISASLLAAASLIIFRRNYLPEGILELLSLLGYRLNDAHFAVPPIGHISYFADFMALHIPLTFGLSMRADSPLKKSGWLLALVILVATVLMAMVRGTWVALGAGIVVSLLLNFYAYRRFPLKTVAGVAAGLGLLLASMFLTDTLGIRDQTVSQRLKPLMEFQSWEELDKASSGRLHLMRSSFKMAEDHPLLGWGLGNFKFSYPLYYRQYDAHTSDMSAQTWLTHPHNETTHQAAQTGWAGPFLFYGIFLALALAALGRARREPSLWPDAIVSLTGLSIVLISWQFDTSFLHPLSRLMVAFYAGSLLGPAIAVAPNLFLKKIAPLVLIPAFLVSSCHSASLFADQMASRASDAANALQWSRLAYLLAPGSFDATYLYNKYLWENGHRDQALKIVDKLYQNYPSVPVVLYVTALARANSGDQTAARRLLDEALSIDPQFTNARLLLNSLGSTDNP